jgi:hypothetical protein
MGKAGLGKLRGWIIGRFDPVTRQSWRLSPLVMRLEPRTVLTAFTMMSPVGLAPLLVQIPPAGGIVLDLIGANGGRLETDLGPSALLRGTVSPGAIATLGVRAGLTPTALKSLGGGLSAVAVRLTMDQGGTGPGEPERHEDFLFLDGLQLGDFSNVVTQQTTPDGLTSLSSNSAGGFRTGSLDTGFFSSTDPTLLADLYKSIVQTGQVVYQFQNSSAQALALDFTAGLIPNLVNPGPTPVFAIDPPRILTVQTTSPIDEGTAATIAVSAVGPHNDRHLTYQFDVLGNGSYSVSSPSGSVTVPFARPGTYTVPFRVVNQEGAFALGQATVAVQNVAPSLALPTEETAVEGSPASFALGSFSDPGPDSPWSVHVNWGDGSTVLDGTRSQQGSLGSAIHTYELDGTYTVTVEVTDRLGASAFGSIVVKVLNVPPRILSLSVGSPVTVGQADNLFVSFSDPGTLDTFEVVINWGDQSSTLAALGIGVRSFSTVHAFVTPSTSDPVTVTITDHGGGMASASTTVVVTAAPTAVVVTPPPTTVVVTPVGSVPGTPPAPAVSISTLAFFNSSSVRTGSTSAGPQPATLIAPGNQPPAQSGPRPAALALGGGDEIPQGGRTLEQILAILLSKREQGRTGPSSNPIGSSSSAIAALVGQSGTMDENARRSSLQEPREMDQSLLARAGMRQDEAPAAHGKAVRLMMLVVWTLSLQNQRWRSRSLRTSSRPDRTGPRQGV